MAEREKTRVLEEAARGQETVKLVLFLLGNGCSPFLIRRWMVLAQYWASTTAIAEKRCRQVDFITNNEDQKKNT